MRKQMLLSGLLLTVLALVFLMGGHAAIVAQNPFSLSLDANSAAGDQGVTSVNTSADQVVAIQVFGSSIQNVNSFSLRFEYDASQVTYQGFDAGSVLPGSPQVLADHGTNPTSVEIGIASLGGQATVSSGLVGTIRFRTIAGFSGTSIRLVHAQLSRSGQSETVTLTGRVELQVSTAPSPDFDGDGRVGLSDYELFVNHFGTSLGDADYDAKYDLDSNGSIGLSDYQIFVDNFGKEVPPSGGGGSPDLIVESLSVSNSTLMTGQSFTLSATVRNQGTGSSASTTLRYYRSSDATISPSDTEVGTDAVDSLNASGTSAESISLNAPSSAGTYYYGACVESVTGESNTDNNCSDGVRVTVTASQEAEYSDFDLARDNDNPQGITYANNRFYVVEQNRYRWAADKVYAYDASGQRDTTSAFDLARDNSSPRGITFANGRFYVVDSGYDKVYAYDASGQRDTTSAFDLARDNSSPIGITYANNRFYVVDYGDDKVYAYDASGQRDTTSFGFDLDSGNSSPTGITFANGRFYVVNSGDDKVYAYDASGQRDATSDFDLVRDNSSPTGITYANNRFYVVDGDDDKVYTYDASGQRDATSFGFDLDSGNSSPTGITFANGRFYVVNSGDDKVYAYDASGQRDATSDFDLDSGNSSPRGITFANGRFYVVNYSDRKVYAYDASGQRDATSDFDLDSGYNSTPRGITFANSRLYVVHYRKVYAYDASGQRDATSDFDLDSGNSSPRGITYANNRFYVVEQNSYRWATDKVYEYDASGQRDATSDFDLDSDNSSPWGITFANGRLYVVDDSDDKVYVVKFRPDLVVVIPSVSNDTPAIGTSFELSATVRNRGQIASTATTLRFYRSDDRTISTDETEVGGVTVSALPRAATSSGKITLAAPTAEGTYYYGACVDAVSGESATGNNCSSTVIVFGGGPFPPTDFDLGSGNSSPRGITFANSRLYVVDYRKVYAYHASGQRDAVSDFDLDSENSNPWGITFANNRFYVVDNGDAKVYVYTSSGQRVASADFDLGSGNSSPLGITFANNRFYVVDGDDKVYAYDASGQRDAASDFDLDSENSNPNGIMYANNRFYVVDGDDKVYVYTSSGQRDASTHLDLDSENSDPSGIMYANNRFYVVDGGGYPGKVYVYTSSYTSSIPDANLRAVIRDSLGKARNVSITRTEMATLTRLDASNKGIRSLVGLEHATNLQTLYLGENRISDISALSNLTNLTGLSLDENRISDISALSNLTNLTELSLSENRISDISALSNLTNLTELDLYRTSISDISALSNLTNLTVLWLLSNSISDISALSNLTNLTNLDIRSNRISDISALSNLTNLTNLWLGENRISDISALSNLTNLTELNLLRNSISDISALSNLTNLTELYLRQNSISDLAPLVSNTGLGSGDEVDVGNNPLSATSINTHIPALRSRGVTVNFVTKGGPEITISITGCSGTRYILRGFTSFYISGTVRANKKVSNLKVIGYANGGRVGVDSLNDMLAGQSQNFSIRGSLSGTQALFVSCTAGWEGEVHGKNSQGTVDNTAKNFYKLLEKK